MSADDPRIGIAQALKRPLNNFGPAAAADDEEEEEEIELQQPRGSDQLFLPYFYADDNKVFIICHRIRGLHMRAELSDDGLALAIELTYPGFGPADVKGVIDIPVPVDAGKPAIRRAYYTLPRRAVPPVLVHPDLPDKDLIILSCSVWRSVAAHGSGVITL